MDLGKIVKTIIIPDEAEEEAIPVKGWPTTVPDEEPIPAEGWPTTVPAEK